MGIRPKFGHPHNFLASLNPSPVVHNIFNIQPIMTNSIDIQSNESQLKEPQNLAVLEQSEQESTKNVSTRSDSRLKTQIVEDSSKLSKLRQEARLLKKMTSGLEA